MSVLKRTLHTIDSINEYIGQGASYIIIAATLFLVYEVVMRYVFNAPTIWAHEMTQFVYGAHFILAGAYGILHRTHVNVDVLYNKFSPRAKAFTDVFTSVFLFLLCYALLVIGWQMGWESFMRMEKSPSIWNPPVYPIKLLVPIEGFLLSLQAIAKFIRDLSIAVSGKELN
ncbi:MAG: TRAP transporter small permease subunit [Dehalococcoidales bacterium]|nr:TRAP transporter small permease subunit [Dehalococcoidales bacterium]